MAPPAVISVTPAMSDGQTIIALGLLTETDLRRLGPGFTRAFPLDERPCFVDLLAAIDEADRENRDQPEQAKSQV